MKASCRSTVLGKRKTTELTNELVLRLNPKPSGASPDTPFPEQDDYESSNPIASTSKLLPIIINGQLVAKTQKCFRCTYAGCQKAYTKPSRLEEHERSHTGQRPFVCETCGNSYLRETHLHAHARSHLLESSRPFKCEKDDCAKRFWTSQHLKVHYSWHDGAKPYKCNEENCDEAFAKHHQLRAHICSEHSPPGTLPFRCEHDGCTRSFDTNHHMKTHMKTHDGKRYTCIHANCLAASDDSPVYFSTWSALQSHIRTKHPPTCLHPSCNGRTFANQGNLRAHVKLHQQQDAETILNGDTNSGDDTDHPPRKKRRGGELGRDWKCEEPDCGKDFKSKKALNTHTNITHLGKRNFTCDHPSCDQRFGYKHLLQRHKAKLHQSGQPMIVLSEDELSEDGRPGGRDTTFDIDMITGSSYAKRAQDNVNNGQALRCPFPNLHALSDDSVPSASAQRSVDSCDYVFTRGYDLRRHLEAFHALVISKETIDTWVRHQKRDVKDSRTALSESSTKTLEQ